MEMIKPTERKMHEKIRKFYVKTAKRFIENVKYFQVVIELHAVPQRRKDCSTPSEN